FTSPSTFLGFKEIFKDEWQNFLKEVNVISIGKTTGKTLKEQGITDFYIPRKSTVEDILDLLQELFKE
ncbi:MAG: uroporphyrinogen-III synthase, partial [Persephonella sp.]